LYDEDTIENSYDENSDDEYFNVEGGNRLPFSNAPLAALQRSSSAPSMYSSPLSSAPLPTLSNRQMKEMFPFCIVFNQKMIVVDCGHSLLEIVGSSPIGSCLNDILEVKQPAGDVDTWSNFLQLYSVANDFSSEIKCSDETVLKLKGIISLSDDCQMAFYMCHADVRTFHEMKQANLQPRHLATQACRIEYLMQMEQLQSEKRASVKLKKVQKELDKQTSLAAKLRTDATIQASKLATQCLENKRTFVRYIGHEIRTPLTVVKLGLKLALADARELDANEDFISNISDCEDSVDVAVAILNDLLAYEKLDSGILEMFKEIIVVVPFVLRSLRPFETQAAEKNIKLTIENNCSGDMMDTLAIYADKSKMCQVIRNFLSNAIKFTPGNGHVTVRISVVSPTKERRRALSDTTSRSASSLLKQMQQHQQPKALSPNKRAQLTSSPANLGIVIMLVVCIPMSLLMYLLSILNILKGSSPNLKERRFMKCTSADSLFSMSSARPAAYKTIKSVFDNEEFQLLENVLVVEFIDSGPGISEVSNDMANAHSSPSRNNIFCYRHRKIRKNSFERMFNSTLMSPKKEEGLV
jgi:signal transduction histidine kinase